MTEAGRTARFGMYESIADFARDRLRASGRARAAEKRHEAWFVAEGARLSALAAAGDVRALACLIQERENLAAVAARALDARRAAPALRALVALDPVRNAAGPLAPHVAALDLALTLPRKGVPSRVVAEALLARGRARIVCGLPGAEADLTGATRRAREPILAGRCTMELGVAATRAGRLDRAYAHYDAARARFARARATRHEAEALAQMGLVLQRLGRLDDAQACYLRALVRHGEAPGRDLGLDATLRTRLGAVRHERGELSRARDEYRHALSCARRAKSRRHEAVSLAALGLLAWEMRQTERAHGLHERAIAAAKALGDRAYEGICLASLGALEATRGHRKRGERLLAQARALVVLGGDAHLARAVGLYRAIADVARARALAGRDPAAAAELTARAARAAVQGDDAGEDVRFARRMLRAELDAKGTTTLAVHDGGGWFHAPGAGGRVSLGARPGLSRILAFLAARHLAAPGTPIGTYDLVAAGWPDEVVSPLAGANRVYVAIATLRKLGLARVLVRSAAGYAIAPHLRLDLVRER